MYRMRRIQGSLDNAEPTLIQIACNYEYFAACGVEGSDFRGVIAFAVFMGGIERYSSSRSLERAFGNCLRGLCRSRLLVYVTATSEYPRPMMISLMTTPAACRTELS